MKYPGESSDIGPPKTGIGIEEDEQERRRVEANLEQEKVADLLHSFGITDPLMNHGSQIILPDNLLQTINGGEGMEKEANENNLKKLQQEKERWRRMFPNP